MICASSVAPSSVLLAVFARNPASIGSPVTLGRGGGAGIVRLLSQEAAGCRFHFVCHEPCAEVSVVGFGEELAHGSAWRWNNLPGVCSLRAEAVCHNCQVWLKSLWQSALVVWASWLCKTTPTPLAFPPLLRGNRQPAASALPALQRGMLSHIPAISVSWLCVDRVGCACSKSDRQGLLVWRGSQSAKGISRPCGYRFGS